MSGQRERRGDRQGGSLAIEAAMLAPAILVMFCLVVGIGRLEIVSGTVDESARAGARSVSLDRSWSTVEEARAVAKDAVRNVLAQQGVSCPGVTVDVIPRTLEGTSVGPLQTVEVDVSCTTTVNDLIPRWVTGDVTMTGKFTSVIDHYRSQ